MYVLAMISLKEAMEYGSSFSIIITFAAFLGLMMVANIFLFHSMELWKLIGFSVGGMVVTCTAILYGKYQ